MDVSLLTLLILSNSSDGVLFVNSTYFLDFELVLLHQPWVLWFPLIFLLVLMGLSDFFWVWFLQARVFITLKISKKHHLTDRYLEWEIDLGRPFQRRSSKGLTLTKCNFSCLVEITVYTIASRKVTSLHCSLYLLTVQRHPYCAHAYADAVKSFYLRR